MSQTQEISKQKAVEKTKQQIPSVDIDLPSGGTIYTKGTPMASGKLAIRYMKGEDEEILISPSYMKSSDTFNVLLKRLILESDFDPLDLSVSDRENLVLSARIMSLGEEFKMEDTIVCKGCGKEHNEVEMKLSDVKEKEILHQPNKPHVNEFTLELPVSKKNIIMKVLTGKDQKEVEGFFDGSNPHIRDEEILTYSVAKSIVSIPDVGDSFGEKIKFVKEMPLRDKRSIRVHLDEMSGGTDFTIPFTCDKCGHTQSTPVNFGLGFFF